MTIRVAITIFFLRKRVRVFGKFLCLFAVICYGLLYYATIKCLYCDKITYYIHFICLICTNLGGRLLGFVYLIYI